MKEKVQATFFLFSSHQDAGLEFKPLERTIQRTIKKGTLPRNATEEDKRKNEKKRKEEEESQSDRGKCGVCEERIVDLAAVPCGHMFCRICWDENLEHIPNRYKSARIVKQKLKEPDCMMCRTPVQKDLRIYFRK